MAPPAAPSTAPVVPATASAAARKQQQQQQESAAVYGTGPPKSMAIGPDAQFGPAHAGLLRLFRSEFFDEWMAVYYMFKYPDHPAIQEYLADALRGFPVARVQEYLPQLIHILVTVPTMTHLEDLIADRCRVSTHFAMLTLWYFQAYLADLEDFPSSAAYDMCVRVVSLVEDIIMAREEDTAEYVVESDAPAAIPPPTTTTPVKSSRDSAVNVHLDTPTKSLPRGSGSPPAPAMVTLAIGPNGTPLRLPNTTPSLEDMHKGKAFSFTNFVQRAAGGANGTTGTVSKRSSMASSSVDDAPNNETSASGSVRARRGSTASVDSVLCNDPKLLEKYYFHSELQFIAALVAISERLVPVPREARQSTLTAELTLLNHNFPAPVCLPLWCHAAGEVRHHQIVRISPTDATVLNSAERVPFLMFVEVIEDDEADAHAAAAESTNALGVANDTTTPRRMPIRRRSSLSMLLETPPASLTAMLNGSLSRRTSTISAASAAAAVNHAADDLGARGLPAEQQAQAEPAAQTAATAARPSSMLSTTSTRRTEFPGEEEFANRMRTAVILLAQLQEQERQMLTAELAEAAAASSPAARRRALLKLRKKKKKKVGGPRLTEEIRNRILREMMALEELRLRALQELNALDIDEGDLGLASTMSQDVYKVLGGVEYTMDPVDLGNAPPMPAGAADLGGLDRAQIEAVKLPAATTALPIPPLATRQATVRRRVSTLTPPMAIDKDDPSGAIVRETWARKRERIRASSGFGHAKHWNLMSVIVKSGADLRQEQLACQLIREMAKVWQHARVACWMFPYRVLVTGQAHGIVETVKNTVSIHSLKKEMYAKHGDTFTLKDFFVQEFGPEGSPGFDMAQRNFMTSLAGYSILCYVLNVKDRHNGNILLDYTTGHIVHIDFGFMLSNSPGAVAFETAPFKLSQEYVDLLGGLGSKMYAEWRQLLVQGFLALRRAHDRIVGLVEVMERDSPLDCFAYTSLVTTAAAAPAVTPSTSPTPGQSATPSPAAESGTVSPTPASSSPAANALPVTKTLRDRLLLSLSDKQVSDFVDRLIANSMGNVFTRLYDGYQWFVEGVMA
ncbi:Phosphatidylinositol 4-kinase pik1alpha (PI4-kinase)(PtdIns-4-kinase) [Allomyces javanicus]|nr:Phosphatidylinositol 4-kinase pik1alpha (PI4-kinase)(PtdIns-4-kinase) [Allomyces javanicus]